MSVARRIRSWFVEEGKITPSFLSLLTVLAAAIILCWPALLNGYPLVYSDTGSYINSGFENKVPPDRPILYGLFLRHFSLKASLWIVVFVQALLTSFSVRLLVDAVIVDRSRQNRLFPIAILLLSCTTGIAQKCSNLLPDFLTAIVCIVLVTQLVKQTAGARRIFVFVLIGFALLAHASHLYILTATLMLLFALRIFRKSVFRAIPLRRLRQISILLAAGFLSAMLINGTMTGRYYVSKSGSIFMIGHLADNGLLDEYLLENCGTHQYELCSKAGAVHLVDFLWDEKHSPLYEMGGWENPSPEFETILCDFFSSPRYILRFISETMVATCRQSLMFAVDEKVENPVMAPHSAPDGQVEWHFKHELESFRTSRQAKGSPGYQFVNLFQYPVVFVSFATMLVLLFSRWRKKMPMLHTATVVTLCFYFVNAFVCSTFTISNSRFSSRVVWLFPLLALLIIAEYLRLKKVQAPESLINQNEVK